ncbi:UNVERIFIED_CONTAM: Canalicular multispecific organic anion transporter 2, partial [Siphonaria sp. JEL0065]
MQPLLIKGQKQELTLEELWRPDKSQSSAEIHEKFNKQWKSEIQMGQKTGKKPWLIRALLKAFYPALLVGFAEYCISFACTFVEPMLLQSMLLFIGERGTESYVGYTIAVGIWLNALLNVLMGVQMWISAMSVGFQIRSSLCSAIFRKSLNLTNTSRQATSTGQINNMMAADTNHIQWFITMIYNPIGIPIKISLAIYLLWQQLGVSCLGGLAVIILAFPVQAIIGKYLRSVFDVKQSRGDTRIEIVNESLTSIKLLKLYGWDVLFHKRVTDARQLELNSIKSIGVLKSLNSLVGSVTPLFVALVSFAIFSAVNAGTDQVLTASRIFVSLSLFNILSEPIGAIGYLFSGGSAALISLNRMEEFLLLEELDDSNVLREIAGSGDVIAIENGTFKWDTSAGENILENINMTISKGSLAAVIGRVGTGKSSLLSSLLGEMQKTSGTVRVSGSVAYVSQQAWIENATVRDNILFGSEYDEVRYEAIIDACALRNDLKLLSAGDMTEIGEKGVNLSGGQKSRLSLARAVYASADIYLLDDVLAAVDAHVDKHIFDNVIGPRGLLKNKTRVLVTHGVHHLSSCDKVVVVKDKTIEQQGNYSELVSQEGSTFKILIDEFAHDVIMEAAHEEAEAQDVTAVSSAKGKEIAQKTEEESKKEEGKLMTKEDAGKGLAKASVFIAYSKAAGLFWVILSFVLLVSSQAATVGTGIWLDHWSSKAADSGNSSGFYLGVYGGIVILASSLTLLTNLAMYVKVGQNAAKVMHSEMLSGVMKSPMSFFDTNPLGRITNRFVGDIQIVDESLVETYVGFLSYIAQSISTIIVICSVTPLFLTLILPLFIVYYYIQFYYLKTAQAIQRIARLTNSPVYALANTSFTGISTLRAFDKTKKYVEKNFILQDDMQTSFLCQMTTNKWLQFRLECIGACISFGAAIFAVVQRNNITAGSAGLSLGYAMQITQYLYHTMRMFGQVQNSGVSLERIFEYFDLPSEAPQFVEAKEWVGSDKSGGLGNLSDWPSEGKVVFKDLKMRYREGTPLILNGISVSLKGGEKVGIVGRTGAGKSSLSVALFRLSEAEAGSIEIDGVDISKIGLNTLRTRLTIIPQEPVLFGASVRDNIDPSHEFSDDAIWRALEASHLKARFEGHEEGLEQKVKSAGENLSVGERQLFCLARALLRNTKVLVLDEASSGIDLETDALIQATIRREFKDATVLTIAHRIQTIMDSDKILVLNAGTVEEFDSPSNLLLDPDSAFSKLAAAAG